MNEIELPAGGFPILRWDYPSALAINGRYSEANREHNCSWKWAEIPVEFSGHLRYSRRLTWAGMRLWRTIWLLMVWRHSLYSRICEGLALFWTSSPNSLNSARRDMRLNSSYAMMITNDRPWIEWIRRARWLLLLSFAHSRRLLSACAWRMGFLRINPSGLSCKSNPFHESISLNAHRKMHARFNAANYTWIMKTSAFGLLLQPPLRHYSSEAAAIDSLRDCEIDPQRLKSDC